MKNKLYMAIGVFVLLAAATVVYAGGRKENLAKMDAPPAMAMAEPDAQPVPPPSARDGVYKKPPEGELRRTLTPLQFQVTQQDSTEFAFNNEYWANHEAGIYVDIVSGEALFSSTDKYESGTGWPSFTRPLEPGNVKERRDLSYPYIVKEVRSSYADSHLGHVFDDGPPPAGLRYCINSAALRFIPVKDLQKEGYGEYLSQFDM